MLPSRCSSLIMGLRVIGITSNFDSGGHVTIIRRSSQWHKCGQNASASWWRIINQVATTMITKFLARLRAMLWLQSLKSGVMTCQDELSAWHHIPAAFFCVTLYVSVQMRVSLFVGVIYLGLKYTIECCQLCCHLLHKMMSCYVKRLNCASFVGAVIY